MNEWSRPLPALPPLAVVLFVPSFFTVLQRFEERRKKGRKAPPVVADSAPQSP